jgi:diacylglycerol kinase (ATP)
MEILENNEKIFFVVNPSAGGNRGRKDWRDILSLLEKTEMSFHYEFTEYKLHAAQIAVDAVGKGFNILVAVGGDGTLNEVANGILQQKNCPSTDIALGMIPVGSGNDWCRMFQVPDRYDEAIKCIQNRKTFIQDAGKVRYFNERAEEERFFLNVAGIGFDAEVVRKTNEQKAESKSWRFRYLWNLFTSLLSSGHARVEIRMDDMEMKREIFSMNVGICRYSGGGMMQVPGAVADDGLFDVTLINRIGRVEVIRNVGKLYDGSFIRHPKVETFKAKKIVLDSETPVLVEADGESLGISSLTFEVIPACLKVITGF